MNTDALSGQKSIFYANNRGSLSQNGTFFPRAAVHQSPASRIQPHKQARPLCPEHQGGEFNRSTWQGKQGTSPVITEQPSASNAKVHDHRRSRDMEAAIEKFCEPKEVCQNPVCCVLLVPAALIGNPVMGMGIGGGVVGGLYLGPHIAAAYPALSSAGATALGVVGGVAPSCAVAAVGTYFGRRDYVRPCLCPGVCA